jgi:hypothetical protein
MPAFQPKTEKELASENLLPVGEYDFEVLGAANKTSQRTGAQMIELKVGVYLPTGAVRFVNDNLVFVDKAIFKISQFCKCTGLYERYKAGQLDAEDCKGRSGKLKLGIEPEGEYPAKNKVSSYVIPKEFRKPEQAQSVKIETPAALTNAAPEVEDDVPF